MAEQQSTSDMTRTGFAAMRGAIKADSADELSPTGRAAFEAGLAAIRDCVHTTGESRERDEVLAIIANMDHTLTGETELINALWVIIDAARAMR